MKKLLIVTIVVLLTGANIALGVPASSQIKQKQGQLNDINSKKRDAQQKIEAAKKQQATITSQISESDKNLSKIQSQIDSIQSELGTVTSRRKQTEKELNVVQAELEDTIAELQKAIKQVKFNRKVLRKRIADTYKNGKVSYLEVLLNAKSFTDFVTRASFLQFIIEQDHRILERMERAKTVVQKQKAQVEDNKQRVEKVRANLAAQEQRVAAVKQAQVAKKQEEYSEKLNKQRLLTQVEKNKEYYIQVERQLEQESLNIESMIKDLMSKSSGYAPVTRGSGKFIMPTSGRLSSNFGYRIHPVYKYKKFHSGIDIAAPNGTAIKAAASGRILFSGRKGGYGNTVIIDHGGGLMTLYAHCSSTYVSEGQTVNQGARIAAVGSTGLSTGNHLHFEVRVSGNPVNPMNYL